VISKLAIWVSKYELENQDDTLFQWKTDGIAMDGYHGFGSENVRGYSGMVQLISDKVNAVVFTEISQVHYSRQGFQWQIKSQEKLPDPPFLITDNLNMHVIFSGFVCLDEEQDIIDTHRQDGEYHSICADLWFGIATVKKERKVHLTAFSDNFQVKVNSGDSLYSPEYDCLMGKIVEVQY
jgi:hypothetical protein